MQQLNGQLLPARILSLPTSCGVNSSWTVPGEHIRTLEMEASYRDQASLERGAYACAGNVFA